MSRRVFLAGAWVGLIGLTALAQTVTPAGQISPGNVGSISPAQGVSGTATGASKDTLDDALSPQTRQTLQDAMNSAMILGPGESAELDGTRADRIASDTVPAPLKNALATGIQRTLGDSADR